MSEYKKQGQPDYVTTDPFAFLAIIGFGLIVLMKGIESLVTFAINKPDLAAQIVVFGIILVFPLVVLATGWLMGDFKFIESEKTREKISKIIDSVFTKILTLGK